MTQQKITTRSPAFIKTRFCAMAIAMICALSSGCDSGSSGGHSSAASSSPAKISGDISDIHGPIMAGKLEVTDKVGKVILSQAVDTSGHYNITLPSGTSYPVLLTATPPEGSNSQVVKAVVTSSLADRMDITDITTLVVNAATALGGLTEENIAKASGGAIGMRQRQGVSAGAGGGGAGPGQSGGGVSQGGHGGHGGGNSAGHDMSRMGDGTSSNGGANPMPDMQH